MPLEVLYDGKGLDNNLVTDIDIIAVHGLNPHNKIDHAHQTWLKNDHLWLRDSLPNSLPSARVMLYKYNSSPVFNSDRKPFIAEATALLGSLWVKRRQCSTRPLLLIGHSLGGILIKQAIVNAHMDEKHKDLRNSIFALVFMGTPHYGSTNSSKVMFGKACAKIVQTVNHTVPNGLLKAVERNSTFSDILDDHWRSKLESYRFISCYGTDDKIVPYESTRLCLSDSREVVIKRSANHGDVCRFDPNVESDAEEYEEFIENMKDLCEDALKADQIKNALMPSGFTNELIESLKSFGHNQRYSRIETEHEESLQWVWSEDLEGPNFVKWLKTEERLMWISGKPGAGKSTLMKYIHDHDDILPIMRSSVHGRLEFISYFLHDLGSPTERTFSGLLHGLLSQILTLIPELAPTIHQRFRKLCIRHSTSSQDGPIWSEVELQAAFRDIIKNQIVEATVLCMIDALDECETKQLHPLLRFITNLATHPQKGGLTFKVICSSRRENAIELAFTKFSSFRIENFTSKDIESFIISRLAEVTDNLYPDEKADRVIAEVVEEAVIKAEGVFIWAILVADELILAIEAGQILKLYQTLKDLPSDLEALYANIIGKIPLEVRHHSFSYLRMLMRGQRLVYMGPDNMLGMVLAMQPIEDVLIADPWAMSTEEKIAHCVTAKRILQDRCRGFINLPSYQKGWSQEEMMRSFCRGPVFIHKTVQDYLFEEDGKIKEIGKGIDPKLIPNHLEQHAAFTFRLLLADSTTRKEAVPTFIWLGKRSCHFTDCFCYLMFLLSIQEERDEGEPWAPTWLPALEVLLSKISQTDEEIQDFYDAVCCEAYVRFERVAEDLALEPLHANLLSIAIYFDLPSYFLPRLSELDGPKPGCPYLHYTLSAWSFNYKHFFSLGLILLERGHRLDQVFNGRTTWEYILMHMHHNIEPPPVLPLEPGYGPAYYWDRGEYDKMLLLFLEYGADVNLVVDMHDYACSPLHILLSHHDLPYEKLEPVLQGFLERGADIHVRDTNGVSLEELAEENWPEAVGLLREYCSRRRLEGTVIKERQIRLSDCRRREEMETQVKPLLLRKMEYMEEEISFKPRRPLRILNADGK